MTEAERTAVEGRPVLLFDGVCALCNGFVRFLLRRDRDQTLRFAPLESPFGRELLGRFPQQQARQDGVALITNALTAAERFYHRSDATAQALQFLPSPWRLAGKALAFIPHFLREPVYRLIASLRYRLFGRYAACPLPTPTQRSRILGIYE